MNAKERTSRGELYRESYPNVSSEFPINIKMVWEKFNIYNPPKIEEIVRNHTFLTFTKNLRGLDDFNKVLDIMLHGKRKYYNLINDKEFFQYCHKCVEEDFENYGETYWRLSFQIPTVLICIKHNELLSNSSFKFNTGELQPIFLESDNANYRETHLTKKTYMHLKRIAFESTLLSQIDYEFPPEEWELVLYTFLNKNNFLDERGKILKEKFIFEFNCYYGNELLNLLQIDIKRLDHCLTKFHWLKNLNINERVLVILFLSRSFKEFRNEGFKLNSQNYSFFCENIFCEYYNKNNTWEISLFENYCSINFKYKCCCGFTIKVTLIDQFQSEFLKNVVSYSEEWKKKFYYYAYEVNFSIKELSKMFNCSSFEIEEYLLNFIEGKQLNKLEKYRVEWERLMYNSPESHIAEIKHQNIKLYSWLNLHDYGWHKNRKPNFRYRELDLENPFWIKRDRNLKTYLEKYVNDLIASGYPTSEVEKLMKKKVELLDLEIESLFLPTVKKYVRDFVGDYVSPL
jgi:hypothetical protein